MEFHLVTPEHNCPFTASIMDASCQGSHFHHNLELLFLLNGELTYVLSGKTFHLTSRDFIFANAYDTHSVSSISKDCRIILLSIETSVFHSLFSPPESFRPQWHETYNNRTEALYQQIDSCLKNIIITATNRDKAWLAHIYRDILGILITLDQYCTTADRTTHGQKALNHAQRTSQIMRYLNEHYAETISLNILSDAFHLSAPYISKLFKETFQTGLLEYLNHLRIQKSLASLSGTDDYILDIAIAHGFNNAKTYSRIFQQEMGISPTEYRRQYQNKHSSAAMEEPSGATPDLLHFLYGQNDDPRTLPPETQYDTLSLDFDALHGTYAKRPKKWNTILSVGTAALLLQRHVQEDIVKTAHELGFKYVRFSGVLSDGLQIYQENENGVPYYFWVLLDEILDFLCENKLKPFICLGFMPDRLARRKVPSPYRWNANTSMPKSQELWNAYLAAFLTHCITRYSYEEVCTWKFEFWNAPQLKEIFWHDTEEDFNNFFLSSYLTFRKILPKGSFGSPGFVKFQRFGYVKRFLRFCKQHKVVFDFFCLHMFMLTDPKNTDYHENQIRKLEPDMEKYEHGYISQMVTEIQSILSEFHYNAPIYITEWNISPYYHDLSRDTCFMSAYIADTINHLPNAVENISFWAMTDYMEEHMPYQDLFTGELGLKTHNGLPKPAYLSFVLLNRLKENLLATGDGYCMTASGTDYQILLYNYTFYHENFLNGSSRKLAPKDRYQIFPPVKDKLFNLHLTLPAGSYRIERHALNRQHGSIYDSWIQMGAPDYIDDATRQYLNTKGYPDINIKHQNIDGHLLLSELVPLHGMLLICLSKATDWS